MQGDRKISYVSYHTRAISMGITKAESRTLIDAAHHAKGRLCRMRGGAPAALALSQDFFPLRLNIVLAPRSPA